MTRAAFLPTADEDARDVSYVDLMERPARPKKSRRRPVVRTLHVFMLCATAVVVTLIHHWAGILEAAALEEFARARQQSVERPSIEVTPDAEDSRKEKL